MSQSTATTAEATGHTGDGAFGSTDVLMHLVVILLAPMFLPASDGDIALARLAAFETVSAYRARTHADLISISQIIAFGFSALASISQSLEDGITPTMALRLRGNANASNRSAEQSRRALNAAVALARHETASVAAAPPLDAADEAEIIARVADSQQRVAAARADVADGCATVASPSRNPAPTNPAPTSPSCHPAPQACVTTHPCGPLPQPSAAAPRSPETTQRQMQTMWAAAMADVAAEFTASLPNLPPNERAIAARRASVLSTCANDFAAGTVRLDGRPGPLGSIGRPDPF